MTPASNSPPDRQKSYSEHLSEDPELIDVLYLVTSGIPFDVAFSLAPDERLAWVVIIGRLKGLRFNWDMMAWEPPR